MSKQTTTEALLPCPFCGQQGTMTTGRSAEVNGRLFYNPSCGHCDYVFQEGFFNVEDAVNAWNTRTPSPTQSAEARARDSLHNNCRSVWVCKKCGNCADHCKHKDEANFHEDLNFPCSGPCKCIDCCPSALSTTQPTIEQAIQCVKGLRDEWQSLSDGSFEGSMEQKGWGHFSEAATKIITALESISASTQGNGGWLDIESAPRNEEWCVVGKISEGNLLWWYRAMFWRGGWHTSRTYDARIKPTHYYPLPSPPKGQVPALTEINERLSE